MSIFQSSTFFASICCASSLIAFDTAAEPVTLNALDGSMNISGELVSSDDQFFIIRTVLGEMVLSRDVVECIGAACPVLIAQNPADSIVLQGSDTLADEMMPLLLSGFANNQSGTVDMISSGQNSSSYRLIAESGFGDLMGNIIVNSTSSADAFVALGDETATIGMSARRIVRAEARALAKTGAGMMVAPEQEHIIAVDSLTMIVHPSNPVTSVSINNLALIYTGTITNWRELGGMDQQINVYTRNAGSGAGSVFSDRVTNGAPLGQNTQVANSSIEMANSVMADPAAIGFVPYAFINMNKPLDLISECGIVSSPITFLARTEEYPLTYRLYLYNRGEDMPALASNIVSYATSEAAYGVIEKSGGISLGVERVSHDVLHARMQMDMVDGDMGMTDNNMGVANNDMGMANSNTGMADSDMGMANGGTDMSGGMNESSPSAMNNGGAMMPQTMMMGSGNPVETALIQQVMAEMFVWDNLSTVFRFAAGSEQLERKSADDLMVLVDYLSNAPEGTIVALVGFTDNDGVFSANLSLSQRRAEIVTEQLLALGGTQLSHITFETRAYGPLTPAVCNDTNENKQINRRVEVWIRDMT